MKLSVQSKLLCAINYFKKLDFVKNKSSFWIYNIFGKKFNFFSEIYFYLKKNNFVMQLEKKNYLDHIVLIEKWDLYVNIHENFIIHEHKNKVYK